MKERDKCKLNGHIDAYIKLRNKLSAMIDNAKKQSYQTKIEEGKNDPRSIWKLFIYIIFREGYTFSYKPVFQVASINN